MKEMRSFAGWNFLNISSGMITQYGMGIILNIFFGARLNAAQGIANQVSGQLMIFAHSLLKAVNPIIVKHEGGGKREKVIQLTMSGSKFSFFLFLFCCVPVIIEAPFLLKIWLTQLPMWAVVFCRLQLLRILIEQLWISLGTMLGAEGRVEELHKVQSVLNLLPIVLTFLFFKAGFPPYYLYISWIICWSVLGGGVNLYFAQKNCGLNKYTYIYNVFFPCISVSITVFTCAFILQQIMNEGIFRVIAILVQSLVIQSFGFWLIGLSNSEKDVAIQLLGVLKQRVNVIKLKH